MKNLRHLFLFLSFVTIPGLRAAAVEFYVSPGGNDSNPGTASAPFATLAHARNAVRPLLPAMSGDITVYVKGGNYDLTRPVHFTHIDSGCNGHFVVYRNAPDEKPVFTGGIAVSNWKKHDAGKNIWSAPVPAGANFRQFYVNGVKATRTRSEDELGLTATPSGSFTSSNNFLRSLSTSPGVADLEVINRPNDWLELVIPVAAISEEGEVTLQQPAGRIIKPESFPSNRNPKFLQNAYELLAKPGDWYLRPSTDTLYYIPRPGENMSTAKVIAPVLEQLIVLTGTPDLPVGNLRFEGLTLQDTTWLLIAPGYGLLHAQANQPHATSTNWNVKAAFDGSWMKNVDISQCTFTQLGGNGVNILRGSRNVTVDHSTFHDISGSAIQVGLGWEPDGTVANDSPEIIESIALANNTIHDVATDYPSGCGIIAGYTRNCSILNNTLYNLPYTAISLGWGWDHVAPTFTSGNFISGNLIHDYMRVLADGGGIYCNSIQYQGTVSNNYAYAQQNKYAVYYLDDKASNWSVFDNVAQKDGAAQWFLYKGTNNHSYKNFSDDEVVRDDRREEDKAVPSTVEDNTVVSGHNWPAEARKIIEAAGPMAGAWFSSRPADILIDGSLRNGGFSQGLEGWKASGSVVAGGSPDADAPAGQTCALFKSGATLATTFNAQAGHVYALVYSQASQGQGQEKNLQTLSASIVEGSKSQALTPSTTRIPGLYARFLRTFTVTTTGPATLRITLGKAQSSSDPGCALDRVELRDVTPPPQK